VERSTKPEHEIEARAAAASPSPAIFGVPAVETGVSLARRPSLGDLD
jgi:hypothetical protein